MDIYKHQVLDQTLDKVIDMLKYAETKNTVLFTFETGIAYILLTNIQHAEFGKVFAWLIIPVFVSIIIVLLSFVPNLRRYKLDNTKYNLLFFGDISKLNSNDYLNEFEKKLGDYNLFYEDMVNQIIQVSKIANKKFRLFKVSISVLLVFPLIFVTIDYIMQKAKKSEMI